MSDTNKDFDTIDAEWADRLAPPRRQLLVGSGLAAAGLFGLGAAQAQAQNAGVIRPATPGVIPPPAPQLATPADGKSPWGYETVSEPTTQPVSIRPNEQTLPTKPRAYTDIKSYHAHIYFDEDSYHKAALLRQWVAERFPVELGNWNLTPRGPHVTPSFYFGFTNDLLHVVVPWLQLNSLGLTILLHPNTDDPGADHLYYTAWINRSQPVNGYLFKGKVTEEKIERIYPNTRPSVAIEV